MRTGTRRGEAPLMATTTNSTKRTTMPHCRLLPSTVMPRLTRSPRTNRTKYEPNSDPRRCLCLERRIAHLKPVCHGKEYLKKQVADHKEQVGGLKKELAQARHLLKSFEEERRAGFAVNHLVKPTLAPAHPSHPSHGVKNPEL